MVFNLANKTTRTVPMVTLAAVQHSAITFQTKCELNTVPMLITVEIQYSVSIENKLNLKGGMTYV
jgi:hypothetical protein